MLALFVIYILYTLVLRPSIEDSEWLMERAYVHLTEEEGRGFLLTCIDLASNTETYQLIMSLLVTADASPSPTHLAHSQLQKKVRELEREFENLLHAASDDLEERKVPVVKIRRSLFVHRASDTQTDTDLVAGHRHEIREADTVADLFDILSAGKCWDFLNPGLLMRIIDDHSESQGIQDQRREYLKELQQFQKATTVRQFAKVCNVSTLSRKFSEVVFEMGKDWDNATLEDVENVKQEIRGEGYLSGHMFNFRRSKI